MRTCTLIVHWQHTTMSDTPACPAPGECIVCPQQTEADASRTMDLYLADCSLKFSLEGTTARLAKTLLEYPQSVQCGPGYYPVLMTLGVEPLVCCSVSYANEKRIYDMIASGHPMAMLVVPYILSTAVSMPAFSVPELPEE